LSGRQWQFAREKGVSYYICLVANASADNADDVKITKIRNPNQLWLDGKIIADPVNIQL